jgi:ankyrin repeat protein
MRKQILFLLMGALLLGAPLSALSVEDIKAAIDRDIAHGNIDTLEFIKPHALFNKALIKSPKKNEQYNFVTPLMYAFLKSSDLDTQIIKKLLDLGADPRVVDSNGNTALHYAVELRRMKQAEILLQWALKRGKSLTDRKNKDGISPLDLARNMVRIKKDATGRAMVVLLIKYETLGAKIRQAWSSTTKTVKKGAQKVKQKTQEAATAIKKGTQEVVENAEIAAQQAEEWWEKKREPKKSAWDRFNKALESATD